MSLSELMQEGCLTRVATATPATSATDGPNVATVATVAGCNTETAKVTDKSPFVSNVSNPSRHIQGKRWNPELAQEGYKWCLDCRHWSGTSIDDPAAGTVCRHPDNPFKRQQPLAPRKCRWYEVRAVP